MANVILLMQCAAAFGALLIGIGTACYIVSRKHILREVAKMVNEYTDAQMDRAMKMLGDMVTKATDI